MPGFPGEKGCDGPPGKDGPPGPNGLTGMDSKLFENISSTVTTVGEMMFIHET